MVCPQLRPATSQAPILVAASLIFWVIVRLLQVYYPDLVRRLATLRNRHLLFHDQPHGLRSELLRILLCRGTFSIFTPPDLSL